MVGHVSLIEADAGDDASGANGLLHLHRLIEVEAHRFLNEEGKTRGGAGNNLAIVAIRWDAEIDGIEIARCEHLIKLGKCANVSEFEPLDVALQFAFLEILRERVAE